jgi:[ribosomal protein S18]-alanine N-acetyltransferase
VSTGPHLARVAPASPTGVPAAALADDVAVAVLALEAATQDRPLGLATLLREAAADGVVLLAHDGGPDGPLVGFASARLLGDEAHVIRLAVSPDRRRRGVGRALLAGLIGWTTEVGAASLLLEVRAGNAPALALYADAGFTLDGHRPRYYPDGEDALLLRRSSGVEADGVERVRMRGGGG